jgi:hypothetical protein
VVSEKGKNTITRQIRFLSRSTFDNVKLGPPKQKATIRGKGEITPNVRHTLRVSVFFTMRFFIKPFIPAFN